ncbi:hypothetical protein LIER_14337 [Lithospermum erythrorhizon]|uniref:Sphingomyelin synthase-like domain-containing protein n=1 Tax=Lithospermum erythrorhizon TaxID=34254 RepID=A0AAV3Q0F3_LITER
MSILLKLKGGGLGLVAITYIGVDYIRHISPIWHEFLQPLLWGVLALAALVRIPFYRHWSAELKAALPFLFSVVFMVSALILEAISVRSVSAVLGLDWHNDTRPLPDVGQWLVLALNEKLPQTLVNILRARIIGLHHYLMLFIMLAFSVLFGSIESPGLGIGARYMFTMGIGRLLRTIAFVSTILPSARPWCAQARFQVPRFPHPWVQKYYTPYTESYAINRVIQLDAAYADPGGYNSEFRPDWGWMSFLIDFLRPTPPEGSLPWYHLLKRASGGCNDLIYSGHMLVAVLTAMAWMEAYGGYSSAIIWMLVFHSGQREIRERHHYSVDCILAVYMGIFLWKMTRRFWPVEDESKKRRLNKLETIHNRLMQAAKDSDIDVVREILEEVKASSQESTNSQSKTMWIFSIGTIIGTISLVLITFIAFSDG